jgi:multicomponent Na+:H+ antiporter subunit G
MMGRAAFFNGVPLWEGTLFNELRGHYDVDTHALISTDEAPAPDIPLDGNRSG